MSLALDSPPPEAATKRPDNPYKFLDYFDERDEPAFAGRDQDIAEMVSKISSNRTLVLFGRSGLGKTSLLKAGVFPRLRERGYHPVYVRTLSDPSADLRAALHAEFSKLGVEPPPKGTEVGFGTLVGALTANRTLVIVLDQFEELFTLFRKKDQARNALIDDVADLIDDHKLRLRVVFSLREDYLAELDVFQRRLPHLLESRYRLGALTVFGAREAIVRPLKQKRIGYSQALVARLLDLLAEDGFDPPMLQIVCTEVYGAADDLDLSAPRLELKHVDKLDGLEGIFGRYLDRVMKSPELARTDLLLTRMVLDSLMTQEGTKRAVTAESLACQGRFVATIEEVSEILKRLEKVGLLRREYRGGADWFELIHEKLVEYVSSWVVEDPKFSRFQVARDMIANGCRARDWRTKSEGLLNRGQIDDVIGPFRDRLKLDPIPNEYLVQGAIFNGSETAAYWSHRYGQGPSLEILSRGLQDQDPNYRRGAARVAGQFADPDGRIVGALLSLVEDPDIDVRRAVGRSLTTLREAARQSRRVAVDPPALEAQPRGKGDRKGLRNPERMLKLLLVAARSLLIGSIQTIRDSIRRRGLFSVVVGGIWGFIRWNVRLPRRILGFSAAAVRALMVTRPIDETLAVMAEQGDSLEGYPLWRRLKARRLATRRLREQNEDVIKNLSLAGAAGGARASMVWSLIVWFFFYPFYYHHVSGSSNTLFNFGDPIPYLSLLGAVVGWALARLIARRRPPAAGSSSRNRMRLVIGIVTGATVGMMAWPCLGYLSGSLSDQTPYQMEQVTKAIAVATCGGLLGAIIGWISSSTNAPEILRGNSRWHPFRLLIRSWFATFTSFVFGFILFLYFVGFKDFGESGAFFANCIALPGLTLLGMVASSTATETTAHVAYRSATGSGPIGRWGWATTASVAIPYIANVFFYHMLFPFFYYVFSSKTYYDIIFEKDNYCSVCVCYAFSFSSFVVAFARISALSRAGTLAKIAHQPPRRSWIARGFILAAAVLASLAYFFLSSPRLPSG